MSARGAKRVYGVLGWPVSHSLSPTLHNAVFAATGWPGAYTAWAVPPQGLEDFVKAVRLLPVHGVSVTIPHKQALCGFVDTASARARAVGALNTLYFDGDTLCGDNTDVAGFIAPLRGLRLETALVLGAGGAARAVLAGLQELGTQRIVVAGRNRGKAEALAQHFAVHCVPWEARTAIGPVTIIVNTTPCGMSGVAEDQSPYPAHAFASAYGLAYDIVYTPQRTRFLLEAEAAGWRTQGGLAMFVHQALEQQRLWTGQYPDARVESLLLHMLSQQ